MEAVVLPLTYFGNLSYFKIIFENEEVWIDDKEIYLKQTFRNRMQVLGANGPIDLSVPIVSTKGIELPYDKIKVSYDDPWQIKHWRTLKSAYKSAPFFDEYEDEIHKLILTRHVYLVDLNLSILDKIVELLAYDKSLFKASEIEIPSKSISLKGFFKPSKMPKSHSEFAPYIQVFNYKFGFIPNLSILDLLFNEGPYSASYLLNSLPRSN